MNLSTQAGEWSFPLGVAAGLDKEANLISFFNNLGVGGLEVGTVTPLEQSGNPKPRLFRLIQDKSILNRMGFNGPGADIVRNNILKQSSKNIILGINIGKNKITDESLAIEDYKICFNKLKDLGNYFVVNVSSPNTSGLRDLQTESFIKDTFNELKKLNEKNVPIYIKIAPDLDDNQIKSITEASIDSGFKGLVVCNTTIMKNIGTGGVSGELLYDKAKNVRRKVLEITKRSNQFDVIGVGGVSDFSHLWDFWQQGGKIMQIYSSLIYQGPGLFQNFEMQMKKAIKYFGAINLEELLEMIYEEKLNLPTTF
ncbi:MAG: dihydroorotate dehydrogenase (quinone) [Halobacteriovoraceae bacterium]|nr:dihydroorotate dehydrogenase (quinone) [Halobacteriovoraceae bacterium]